MNGLLLSTAWLTTVAISRSEEHTSELQSLTDISYAVFCLKKKKHERLVAQYRFRQLHKLSAKFFYLDTRICVLPGSIEARHDLVSLFFFFNDTATTEIYTSVNTLSLHDALPISISRRRGHRRTRPAAEML